MNDTNADVIVIGSGMGGLTTAALLARLHGKKVIVLERHYRAGGFTHTFSRPGGFTWDVGVHYVGEINVPGAMQQAMQVATGGTLQWAMMTEGFDRLRFPGFEFVVRQGEANFRADLHAAFPAERAGIDRFFRDVHVATRWVPMLGMRSLMPRALHALASFFLGSSRALARMTTRQWLDAHLKDERLKGILGSRWGDYGPPPKESSFFMHAVIVRHYFEGATYPVGGAGNIAKAAQQVIEAAGGEVRVNAEVSRIVVEGGRAVGVQLKKGDVLRAPVIVSDAGARATFLKLLPPEVDVPFRGELDQAPTGMAHLSLYLGLSASPASLGLDGANLWLHDAFDQDALFDRAHEVFDGNVPHAAVFFPSLKDPEATAHTVEVIVHVDPKRFAAWAGTRWMKRGAEYLALKQQLTAALLARVERDVPGLSKLVVCSELSTPLSTEHFTGHRAGEIYGIPATPQRFTREYLTPRTLVPGLFLTGADALVLGIGGAVMSGVMCTAAVAGMRTFPELAKAAKALPPLVVSGPRHGEVAAPRLASAA
jgi:phytoene dehydrogenase-like protein